MIAELALMGAALTLALLLVMRMLWARSRRRFDAMLDRVDDQLGAISDSLRDAIERSDELKADAVQSYELTWDGIASPHERLGYGAELEQEVNRARATQQPLSLVVLDVHDLAGPEGVERTAAELAALVGRFTRANDRVVRHGDDELVVLLPQTPAEAAWRFHERLRVELEKSFDQLGDRLTVLTDVVEWKPTATSQSLDARSRRVVGHGIEGGSDVFDLPDAG